MSKIAIAIIASLLAGFAVGSLVLNRAAETGHDDIVVDAVAESEVNEQRLAELERVVQEEREARLVLEDQLVEILQQMNVSDLLQARVAPQQDDSPGSASDGAGDGQRPRRDYAAAMQRFQERRTNMLVEGGYSEGEARRLIKLESEAQYQSMLAYHEAQRAANAENRSTGPQDPQAILRNQLGDEEYERYLLAQGEPTSVQVANVLDGSPGNLAGLEPGDRIVSYNGERTFSMSDLHQLTLQGNPGENVIISIDRDGVPMQLSVPRGLIGMNGFGARVRGSGRRGGQ